MTHGLVDAATERGVSVVLADGRVWALPLREPSGHDAEFDALLLAWGEAEDRSEQLRAGLALTIFLLTRQHDLTPEILDALLTFAAGDPRKAALEEAVGRLAVESLARLRASAPRPQPVENPGPGPGPGFGPLRRWARSLWPLWTS